MFPKCKGPARPCEDGEAHECDRLPGAINRTDTIRAQPSQGLRPYQAKACDELAAAFRDGARRVLHVSPTGSGKTVLFCSIVADAVRYAKRVLIVGHRIEILEQVSAALFRLGIHHGLIAPGFPDTKHQVQVASIASLGRRLSRHRDFDIIIVDEAHHAVSPSWRSVIQDQRRALVLGVTATPERLDGRGLGDLFDVMVPGPTTADLIQEGWLSPFSCFAPVRPPDLSGIKTFGGDFNIGQLAGAMARPVFVSSAVDSYENIAAGKRAIVYAVNIAHSKMLAERFTERGRRAVHLDGDTPNDQRKASIARLAAGELEVICNCGLISEGLDVPAVEAVLLARPTQSLALYLQMVGRALRPAPGKDRAIILDVAGNLYRHGMPDAEREWSLTGKPRKQRESGPVSRLRCCEACAAINAPKAPTCTTCAASLRPTPAEQLEIKAELELIEQTKRTDMLRKTSYREALEWAGDDEERLRQVAQARGYKAGWIWHRLQELRGAAA